MLLDILLLIIMALILMFGAVLLFGAPWVPTLKRQKEVALDLLDLKKGETMLELGCGDGRILKAAAERGWNAVGYELNPLLALSARLRTIRYYSQVRIVWGNYWTTPWPKAEGIFVFSIPKYMTTLDNKIVQRFSHPVKVVSFAFKIPGRQVVIEKESVYLYLYN